MRSYYRSIVSMVLIYLSFCHQVFAQYQPKWESLDTRPAPAWWTEAKFGIFIHWGLYSVPAYAPVNEVEGVYEKYAEHYANRLITKNKLFTEHHLKTFGPGFTYSDFAPMFKAEFFDPDKWADLIQRSGARYVVLTSKHHDGFCLWPSKESPEWNSVKLGPRRDLVAEISESVRKKGLHMGLYYSLLEWDNPFYKKSSIDQWVDQHMIPQMKDLVTRYKPEVIFADGEWDYTSDKLKSEQFIAWLYNESPVKESVIVNDRWGLETRSKHGGYYTTEYDLVHNTKGIGDKASHPWEESRGIGTSYGYNRFEGPEHYISSKQLIHLLIDKVSHGGNLLLNIGPEANGLIPVVMQERLLDIGRWLSVNGEAIYATTAWTEGSLMKDKGISFTRHGKDIYAICTKWQDKPFTISSIKKAGSVKMLGVGNVVKYKLKGADLTIYPPNPGFGNLPSDYAWVYKIENVLD